LIGRRARNVVPREARHRRSVMRFSFSRE
jgi:hypothetical protein